MDIDKIRKYTDSEYTGYEIAKEFTQFNNEVKDRKQGFDITMSDYFKTLREPLIEQQKNLIKNKID